MRGDREIAEERETAGDVGSSEGVGEVEERSAREVGGDGENFERGGKLVEVALDEADKEAGTSGESVPNDVH